jgi:hypothetical protein
MANDASAFQLDGKSYQAELYPNDGTDNDVQPNPLHVVAGVTVMMSAKVVPNCLVASAPPLLVVRSHTGDGQERDDSFTPSGSPKATSGADQSVAVAVPTK